MVISTLFLILSACLGGITAFFIPSVNQRHYRLGLIFGGSYLFAITVIHILPELFGNSENPGLLGIIVLVGFFMQQLMENYTSGAEHGHIHQQNANHNHSHRSIFLLILALSIHGFLEGTLLSHSDVSEVNETHALLWGIVLHKAPAGFALITLLLCNGDNRFKAILLLILFSFTSPLGLLTGHILLIDPSFPSSFFPYLFALVGGNFLHISTTIVFESNENHALNVQKWLISLAGAMVAVLAEVLIV